jgi:hypothetical protein
MIIDFYRDAGTLINFMNYEVVKFDPGVPELRDERVASIFRDGEDILYVRHKNAVATLQIIILGATAAAVDTSVEAISEVLSDILALRGTGGSKIYLRFQPQGSSSTWRAEVLSVRMVQSEDRALENYERAFYSGTSNFLRRLTLIIERVPYWESINETELSLSNGHGSGTGGVTVHNTNDGSNDNYVQISGSAIGGSERTPLRVRFKNTQASADKINNVWICRNGRYTPNTTLLTYEAENYDRKWAGATASADTKWSNGSSLHASGSLGGPGVLVIEWDMAASDLQKYRGRWFHVLINTDRVLSYRCKMRVMLEQISTLSETPYYDVTYDGIHDLGAVKIPPFDFGNVTTYPLSLAFEAYDPDGGNVDFYLDCVHLYPSEPADGFLIGDPIGYQMPQNWGVMFNGIERRTYTESPASGVTSHYAKGGRYIEAEPGEDCRLIFTWDKMTATGVQICERSWTAQVQAWYRQRRLHI